RDLRAADRTACASPLVGFEYIGMRDGRVIARPFLFGTPSSSLIPVLVTGIQPPRVCAMNDSFPV
ncbi:hypothetical protein, partial [Paraburkholderia sp. SIMBA_030]|uniref:hypothetical protein n=1 Tax=Paraburkholderia sp. SIMBA_030 TaxID=3085773 RepID=UPI00397CE7A6